MKDFLSKPVGRVVVIGGATILLVVFLGLLFGSRDENQSVAENSGAGGSATKNAPSATDTENGTSVDTTKDDASKSGSGLSSLGNSLDFSAPAPRRSVDIGDLVVDHGSSGTGSGGNSGTAPAAENILNTSPPNGSGGPTPTGPIITGVGQMGSGRILRPEDMAPEMDPTAPYNPPAPTLQQELRAHTDAVRTKIVKARVMKSSEAPGMEVKTLTAKDGADYALLIDIDIENVGMTPIFYRSWNEFLMFDVPVVLNDDIGSMYRHRTRKISSGPGAGGHGRVVTINDNNIDAAIRNSKVPVAILFTCLNNDEGQSARKSIQYLADEYAGRVNVGCFVARPGTEPNTFYNTPAILRYKIKNVPVVLICADGEVKACVDMALGPIEDGLDLLLGKPKEEGKTIAPGETFRETVAFDIPKQGASVLKLTLPAMAVGSPGQKLEYVIPTQSIEVIP